MRIKLISLILTAFIVCGMMCSLPLTASAIDSGKCGDNLTWTLDDNGMLTVSGTGEMWDYNYDKHLWKEHRNEIVSVQIDKGVTSIGDMAFSDCENLKGIAIPDGVESIGYMAFGYCDSLASITIPNSVTVIDGRAFYECSALAAVAIPNGVKSIGECVFYDCKSLACITIPNSVEFIGNRAFWGCGSLTDITIPDRVKGIGEMAFYECSALTNIQVDENNPYYTSFDGVLYNKDKTRLICCPGGKSEIEISDSVVSIGECAFYGCGNLTSVTIPNGVTDIGNMAFRDCIGLMSVTIPQCVESIGDWAFYGCKSLTGVRIPSSVTSIGQLAFEGCESLINITIPSSVEFIGVRAFHACKALTGIQVDENNPSYTSFDGVLYSKDKTELILCPAGKNEVEIATGVTDICDDAFSWCSGLTSIAIPDSVTSIGDWAFFECSRLTSVTIPDSVKSIGKLVFCHCRGLTNITLPNGIEDIGDQMFDGCERLMNITIPNSVTSIGWYAFGECRALTNVAIPNSVTRIGELAFGDCGNLASITVPNSVTSIGDWAFSGCPLLTVYGGRGSYVQKYADNNEIRFVAGMPIGDKVFSDVNPGEWYVDAVRYALTNSLFNGTGETTFEPNTAMTRAMLVKVLYNLEGDSSPSEYDNNFSDVKEDQWYTEAVKWAGANEIVYGTTDTTFSPNDEISREQLSTILYRYSQFKGYDISDSGELTSFPDGENTSDYAKEAVSWAVGAGLISGNKIGSVTMLDAKGNATRAQVALILMRYKASYETNK